MPTSAARPIPIRFGCMAVFAPGHNSASGKVRTRRNVAPAVTVASGVSAECLRS